MAGPANDGGPNPQRARLRKAASPTGPRLRPSCHGLEVILETVAARQPATDHQLPDRRPAGGGAESTPNRHRRQPKPIDPKAWRSEGLATPRVPARELSPLDLPHADFQLLSLARRQGPGQITVRGLAEAVSADRGNLSTAAAGSSLGRVAAPGPHRTRVRAPRERPCLVPLHQGVPRAWLPWPRGRSWLPDRRC